MAESDSSAELLHERQELLRAERDLRDGSRRIDKQRRLIDRLNHQGHDTVQAEELLGNFEQMLVAWSEHRDLIRARVLLLERQV